MVRHAAQVKASIPPGGQAAAGAGRLRERWSAFALCFAVVPGRRAAGGFARPRLGCYSARLPVAGLPKGGWPLGGA